MITSAAGTDNYIRCTGHCDMFQDEQDRWWGVCLGMRMRDSRFMMGRESFLVSGKWEQDGWPNIDTIEVTFSHHVKTTIIESPKSGLDWLYIRNANLQDHEIDDRSICLLPSKADLSRWQEPVSFVGKRQRKLEGHTSVILTASKDGLCRAGLVNYKDEHPYTRIWYDSGKRIVRFGVINNAKKILRGHEAKIENDIEELHLLMKYTKKQLVLQYMEKDGALETIGTFDTEELSNANFVGPIIGVFATSDSNCSPPVLFKNFRIDQ
ncbi:hypothetical protein D6C84_07493 [Aureobasidium pullulans]|uniref:Beta-xylosidase C-terminal Concanavalin A-like domain-containing protein n=1 Tax=Aureobasidium pullulans TaxID=5580 RepID=A0A4S9XNM7_AURPU|nr:hypothetical protein D6C84_07493 [Aureobasidium pullulans]